MNYTIQQLHYLVALDIHRSFSKAAAYCRVTQPTLSMQVRKLESDLGTELVDRSKTPLSFTVVGRAVVEKAREALAELQGIDKLVNESRDRLEGDLRVGVIPTLAPYLVPRFLGSFLRTYPDIHLHITEYKTEEILERLKSDRLDVGLLATPLNDAAIAEEPLFYEQLLCYMNERLSKRYGNSVELADMLHERLWVLSEGNCFRNQTVNLCALHQLDFPQQATLHYESGSLEALMRLADLEGGLTIVPELAVMDMTEKQLDRTKFIGKHAHPVREISTVTRRKSLNARLVDALRKAVLDHLPKSVLENRGDRRVAIHEEA